MHLEVYVEEPSAEAAMEQLLPKLLPEGITFGIYNMGDKFKLLNRLPSRLLAYRDWPREDVRILVLVDRDDEDCTALKQRLDAIAHQSGLRSRTADPRDYQVINRIVIEELEAWFFGDVPALTAAYPRLPNTLDQQARFRDPDAIAGGTWEALERVLKQAGYFQGGLEKIKAAREVARHMDPARNRSQSFQSLRRALMDLASPEAS